METEICSSGYLQNVSVSLSRKSDTVRLGIGRILQSDYHHLFKIREKSSDLLDNLLKR